MVALMPPERGVLQAEARRYTPVPRRMRQERRIGGSMLGVVTGTAVAAHSGALPRALPIHDYRHGNGKQSISDGDRLGAALAAREGDALAVQKGEHYPHASRRTPRPETTRCPDCTRARLEPAVAPHRYTARRRATRRPVRGSNPTPSARWSLARERGSPSFGGCSPRIQMRAAGGTTR